MEDTTTEKLSQEEIDKRKEEMLNFYKEQIEFLKVQEEFEALAANIEEHRLRRAVAIIRTANLQAPPESQTKKDSENQQEGTIRPLKADK